MLLRTRPSLKKTALVALMSLQTLLVPMTPATAANLYTGACAVRVKIDFVDPIRLTGTFPRYDITLSGAVDLDSASVGVQACALTFDTFEPLRRTDASGKGNSTMWSCSSVLSSGSWNQTFQTRTGMFVPSSVFGTHTLTGTWDAWTLEVANPDFTFVGVAELTLDGAAQNQKVGDCVLAGVWSLTMIGTMVFQDP
jgi:hypothetical protein